MMNKLHISCLENRDGEVHWVLYEEGHFDTPIKILTDDEAKSLRRELTFESEREK